jgi:hypothetical protein
MLLNEGQKQQRRIDELQGEIDAQKALLSGKTQ